MLTLTCLTQVHNSQLFLIIHYESLASDNDEADNSSQYSSDTDDIGMLLTFCSVCSLYSSADDDDELEHPVSDSSDTGGERVIAGHGAVQIVKLGQSVECTETNSPQELVLTGR